MVRPAQLRRGRIQAAHRFGECPHTPHPPIPGVIRKAQLKLKGIEHAKHLCELVDRSTIFENVTPRSLTLVVFRLLPRDAAQKTYTDAELNLLNTQFHNRLAARHDTFLTQTVLHSKEREIFCIRFAVGGWRTSLEDVETIWRAVEQEGERMLEGWRSEQNSRSIE